MRASYFRTVAAGVLLAAAVAVVMAASSALQLRLDAYALAGVLAGGVAALVPDRGVTGRVVGVAAGLAVAWIGFLVRAAVMPDTSTGRTLAAVAVVLLATLVALVPGVPMWAVLLGAGVFAGAYESTYAAAPPEVMSTSVDAITGLGLALVAGFVVAGIPIATRATGRASVVVPGPRDGVVTPISHATLMPTEQAPRPGIAR